MTSAAQVHLHLAGTPTGGPCSREEGLPSLPLLIPGSGLILPLPQVHAVGVFAQVWYPSPMPLRELKPRKPHLVRSGGLSGEVSNLYGDANRSKTFLKQSLNRFTWSPAGQGDVTTWAQVMDRVAASKTSCKIGLRIGETYHIPSSSDYYPLNFASFEMGVGAGTEVHIDEGATLLDCGGAEGPAVFKGYSSDAEYPSFHYSVFDNPTGAPGVLLLQFGATLKQQGTSPLAIIPDNLMLVLAARYGSPFDPGGLPNQETIRLEGTGILLLTTIGTLPNIPDDYISGGASSLIGVQHDGAGKFPANQSAFLGSAFNLPLGNFGGSGPTGFRPSGFFGPTPEGCSYFDTDVGLPLWYRGAQWVDAAGNVVPLPGEHP